MADKTLANSFIRLSEGRIQHFSEFIKKFLDYSSKNLEEEKLESLLALLKDNGIIEEPFF